MRILSGDHLIFAIAKKIIGLESAKSVLMKQAVQSWCEDKVLRPNQKASRTYKQRAKRLLRNNDTNSENESLLESYSETTGTEEID